MRPDSSFVQQPVRSLQTMLRVLARDDHRYQNVIPDGIYGADTANAVTAFQRQNNLPITGIVDQQTWDSIIPAYESALVRTAKAENIEVLLEPGAVFSIGDSNPHIYLIQAMLSQLADEHNEIPRPGHTGTLDWETERSLRAFKRLAGLPEDGRVDRNTWKHLSKQFTLSAHHSNRSNK